MSEFITAGSQTPPRHVLVVEDDRISREVLRATLERRGFAVTPTDGYVSAQRQLEEQGFQSFDCVVTDYLMPDHTGLDLLRWLKSTDASLATIILTAEGEKSLVADLLRSGASDYLEKPLNLKKLYTSIDKAIEHTREQRQLVQLNSEVKRLGRTQMWMVQSGGTGEGKPVVDVCFHPKLEAGGDFLGHFEVDSGVHCCLLTDVSGHDLQAAFVSAYFHGIFRGMLLRAAPLAQIFDYFNQFLVREWNQEDKLRAQGAVGTSIATVALLIDQEQQIATVIICGAPVPVYVAPEGRAQEMGRNSGPPLGWFPDPGIHAALQSIAGAGIIHVWTDGLEDLAAAQGVQPLALAFALQRARRLGVKLPVLDQADDDILFGAIRLPSARPASHAFHPILLQCYRGDQPAEIDSFVTVWRRHLRVAMPGLSEQVEHDVLLAAREGVLNGMVHGCGGSAQVLVRFQLSCRSDERVIRMWIEDGGPGHTFDLEAQLARDSRELVEEHRGLMLMSKLADSIRFERNRATVILDFRL